MYYSSRPPFDANNSAWVENELRKITEALNNGSDTLRVSITYNAPSKMREVELRYADGEGWNPADGEGLYLFRSGTWRKVDVGATPALRSLAFFLGE